MLVVRGQVYASEIRSLHLHPSNPFGNQNIGLVFSGPEGIFENQLASSSILLICLAYLILELAFLLDVTVANV
jgi:hypothetical protein